MARSLWRWAVLLMVTLLLALLPSTMEAETALGMCENTCCLLATGITPLPAMVTVVVTPLAMAPRLQVTVVVPVQITPLSGTPLTEMGFTPAWLKTVGAAEGSGM